MEVAARLAALELVVAARAVDLRGIPLGRGTQMAYELVRTFVAADTPVGNRASNGSPRRRLWTTGLLRAGSARRPRAAAGRRPSALDTLAAGTISHSSTMVSGIPGPI